MFSESQSVQIIGFSGCALHPLDTYYVTGHRGIPMSNPMRAISATRPINFALVFGIRLDIIGQ